MTASSVTERLIPGGRIFFDLFNAVGAKTGERYLGLTPGFTISIASDKIQSYSAEDGLLQLDDETLVKITRTGKLTIRQISMANLSMFLDGSLSTPIQVGAAVNDEAVSVLADRYYPFVGAKRRRTGREGSLGEIAAGAAKVGFAALGVAIAAAFKGGVDSAVDFESVMAVASTMDK